ncbi:hypothetical protein HZB58_04225 [Candidatus Gottesmanbacteria bacterium]|nr:hypothetical protein [Candidatus Gottesmanbacteria bacterium]
MGFFSLVSPEQKYERPDPAIDQRTFDKHGAVVEIDDNSHEQIWSDALSVGIPFKRNVADKKLGIAMQGRRGEILVTRSQRTQDTRAVAYRARRHGQPTLTLSHRETRENLPRENERRSLETALHGRHTRGYTPIPEGTKVSHNQKLAAGGFQSNLGREYKLLALAEELEASQQREKAARRKSQPPADDIPF